MEKNTFISNNPTGSQPVVTDFTAKSNEAQYILLGDTTLEKVDTPDYTGDGNCVVYKHNDNEDKDEKIVVWSQAEYDFLEKQYDKNYTVHPSLWNNGRNNHLNGVFRVHDEMPIFQVRGYDMANISFVYTGKSWLIFDTLMSGECTQVAVDLFNDYLDKKYKNNYAKVGKETIEAVIVSHSHIDHYGGLQTLKDINGGELIIYAPKGFEQHAVSENLYAGVAMGRRASYQYGTGLAACPCGRISIGIGQGQSKGTVGYLRPSFEVDEVFMNSHDHDFKGIKETGRRYLVFGNVRLYFQLTPGTEAPAEMNNYLEFYQDGQLVHRALWMAENCNGTLHNLYTLRGAQVRDAKAWSDFLMQTLSLWPDAEVVFQAHNWPRVNAVNKENAVNEYLFRTAAAYKYLNDQCLLYMNQGFKPDEIAEKVRLPKPLECTPYLRPYYGTLKHNARAVYQRYLGWYDANPVHLDPLPEKERAEKYAALLLQPAENLVKQIEAEYKQGNYRFVADVCYQLLLGKAPNDEFYRDYLANSLQQLGFLAESGIWRNSYLSGAGEVREGTPQQKPSVAPLLNDDGTYKMPLSSMMRNMSNEMLLDYLAIVLDTDKASALGAEALWSQKSKPATTDFYLGITSMTSESSDDTQLFHVSVEYGVLLYRKILDEDISSPVKVILTSENLYSLIANIGNNANIKKIVGGLTGDDRAISLLQQIFCYMVNINRYATFDIMQPCNDRYYQWVEKCAGMLEESYDKISVISFDTKLFLSAKDKVWWNYIGRKLVDAGIIDDLYFFSETPAKEYDEIGYDKTFYKYQYCETLYECYKYLAGNYVPDSGTQFVKFCIDMVEPYVNRFRRKPGERPDGATPKGEGRGAEYYPFDEDDLNTWKKYCLQVFGCMDTNKDIRYIYNENIRFCGNGDTSNKNPGIGQDGEFYGSELLHFLYLCYRFLYDYKHKTIG